MSRTVHNMTTTRTLAIVALAATLTLTACSSKSEEPAPTPTATNAAASDHAHARGDGTISAIQGVTLELGTQTIAAGKSTDITFKITRGGETITDFVESHTKMMHVVIVREDLTGYQHLHPVMAADGNWTLPVKFATGGNYHIVSDFKITEGARDVNYVLGTDVIVDGEQTAPVTLPAPADRIEVDGFVISLSGALSASEHGMLMATVTKDGVPVTFEEYLGTTGHLVAIREGDLAYAHMHPSGHDHGSAETETISDGATATSEMETEMGSQESTESTMDHSMPGMIHFDTEFPTGAGTYKFFFQFQVEGKVHTAEFVAIVG